jgi:branched-chain amino acid transport system permease protein
VPLFGGWGGIVDIPAPTIGSFAFTSKPQLYYMGLFFLALTVVVYYLLYNSKIGRAWNAISSSLRLARSVGINVVRYRMANVLIGNFFIALAGSFFVAYYRAAIPTIFSFNAGILVIVYLIIGGLMHFLTGPILGALIATFIPEFISRFKGFIEYQSIVIAVIVILILMFLPMGILGWVDQRVRPWLYRQKWYWRISRWGVKETPEFPV